MTSASSKTNTLNFFGSNSFFRFNQSSTVPGVPMRICDSTGPNTGRKNNTMITKPSVSKSPINICVKSKTLLNSTGGTTSLKRLSILLLNCLNSHKIFIIIMQNAIRRSTYCHRVRPLASYIRRPPQSEQLRYLENGLT